MSSADKNLSDVKISASIDVSKFKFGIVVAEWNEQVTESLYSGAYQTLINAGADRDKIERMNVPGTFELSLGGQWMAERKDIDAVICLGCVIQGETRHFDFICDAVANGITNVSLKFNKPVIFGVLTPNTMKQALDRAGGKHGNKGDEAAATAIKMLGVRP
ncbi:MAG: 6,7-dimethyl-8-ribityllumazine synthase [Ekhidna sp.]|uniref:6,7-dimethyl-8-ribityllumazine synthase n=1 Tax=Ekhidna sp. TaxID=2608089 RepID=UPI0032F04868